MDIKTPWGAVGSGGPCALCNAALLKSESLGPQDSRLHLALLAPAAALSPRLGVPRDLLSLTAPCATLCTLCHAAPRRAALACADTGAGSDEAEQAEKRRRFVELRKRHYNMKEALKK